MSNAERIYSSAVNHAQTVQICIDRLHEFGANEQLKLLTGMLQSWRSGRHRKTTTNQLRPLSAPPGGPQSIIEGPHQPDTPLGLDNSRKLEAPLERGFS